MKKLLTQLVLLIGFIGLAKSVSTDPGLLLRSGDLYQLNENSVVEYNGMTSLRFWLSDAFSAVTPNTIETDSFAPLAEDTGIKCNEYAMLAGSGFSETHTSLAWGIPNTSGKIIDGNENTYTATASLGSAYIQVKDGNGHLPAGSYAGFIINNVNIIGLGNNMKVTTYLNGNKQEEYNAGNLINSLLDNGKRRIGFVTTEDFDAIRFTKGAGINIGEIRVYYAQVVRPCENQMAEFTCNEATPLVQADDDNSLDGFPVVIETSRSGLDGGALGVFENADRVVDADVDNSMTMSVNIGVLGSASVSVRKLGDPIPAGYFAGFNISNGTIADVQLFNNIRVRTYLNGTMQEDTNTGLSLLDVPLFTSSDRRDVGFVTTKDFDEIRFTINQPVGVSLGAFQIYHAVSKKYCEGETIECNVPTSLTSPEHPVDLNMSRTGKAGVACAACDVQNPGRILDSDPDNYATIYLVGGVGTSGFISVKNGYEAYSAGHFAGFEISSADLINVNVLNNIQIKTFKDGDLKETVNGTNLLVNGDVFAGAARHIMGFVTKFDFDEMQLVVNNVAGANIGVTNVYGAIVKKYCEGESLECNTNTALTIPEFPVDLSMSHTGILGGVCAICGVDNPGNILDSDPDNYASINLTGGALVTGNIAVKNGYGPYDAGTYAGFEIQSSELVSVSALNNIKIKTYLDGSLQETFTGATLLADGDMFSISTRYVLGYVTTKSFDEFHLEVSNPVGANIDILQVYAPIVKKYCDVELACNTETTITSSEHPVDINYGRTGVSGIACVLCGIDNPHYVLDDDQDNFAMIYLPASVANVAGISVKNGIASWPANTYAAFDVSYTNIINAEVLGGTTIELYKDGQLVQSGTGDSQLITANTTITSSTNRGLVGIVSNVEFDEARFAIRNLANVDLGSVNVYSFELMKGCDVPFTCQTSGPLVQGEDGHPVVIEHSRTGKNDFACVLCEVNAPWKVVNEDLDDMATINNIASVGSSGSISVRDLGTTYPAGTTAGFVVQDPNPIIQAGLLSGITIQTYLNGQLRETHSGGGALIDVNAILPWLGTSSQKHAIGFVTTKSFNEIRITYTTLVQAIEFLNVYYAFVDGRFADDDELDIHCGQFTKLVAVPDYNQTPKNNAVSGNVLTNDLGTDLTVTEASYMDANGNYQTLPLDTLTTIYDENGNTAGQIILHEDDSYTFTPANDYTGTTAPIKYTAKDVNGFTDEATLVIKVLPDMGPGNNQPVAQDDYALGFGDDPVTGNLLDNDVDPDGDSLTVTNITVQGQTGPVTVSVPSGTNGVTQDVYDNGVKVGTITVKEDGSYTFVAVSDYEGKVPPVNYVISDGNNGSDDANLHVIIREGIDAGVNIYTVAKDDTNIGPRGVQQTGNILDNDSNTANNTLHVTSITINGNAYPVDSNNGATANIPGVGSITVNADGSYTFDPDDDFVGTIDIPYTVCDDFGHCADATLHLTTLNVPACITAKVLLQGAMVNTTTPSQFVSVDTMRDNLRVKGLIPVKQPYEAIYGYEGREEVTDPAVFDDNGNNSIVDWVLLELRDQNDPTVIKARRAALVQRDGDIVDVDGVSCVSFPVAYGDYYLSVRHRNHFGAMSKDPIAINKATVFDFITEDLYEISGRAEAPVFTKDGNQVLWAGDVNADGFLKYDSSDNDVVPILNFILAHPGNFFGSTSFAPTEYSIYDANMDGVVKAESSENDPTLIRVNVISNSNGNIFEAPTYNIFLDNIPR